MITDAIKDENVLKFSVEYVGRYRYKEGGQNEVDIEVEDIDRQELIESPRRLEKIVDYILAHHDRKTHSRAFTAMFCVSSVEALTRYYDLFRAKREAGEHNLRIATIFTYGTNEEDADANGFIPEESFTPPPNPHTREKLESFIGDYNALYGTDFSTKTTESFYNYYQDIAKRVKGRQVDILLVVNMFLTGFDSKALNTLYVDKNLRYHGLIQAFSRTNRILNEQKSQGNIVCFRNLKKATDEAIKLFSNIEAKEVILMEPYEAYLDQFAAAFAKLLDIAPTAKSVDALEDEEAELEFIKAFRELLRVKNILTTFADFEAEDLPASEQVLEDYKSKYLDLYDKVKSANAKEKVSILDDVDFELELIHRDEINVAYILQLLSELKNADETERKRQRKNITDLLTGESHLRSKRELIERFIDENMVRVESADQVGEVFEAYWSEEQTKAFEAIHKEEGLDPTGLQKVIDNYLFTERKPLRDEVVEIMAQKPRLLERKAVAEKAIDKILNYVETFIDGMGF